MELAMSAGFQDDARSGRDEIDLGGTAAALGRSKGLILGATAGCAAAALAFCLVVKPRYIAEARVIVEDQESFYTRADPASTARDAPQIIDAEAVNSQLQLVSSRDIARKVASTLRLQDYPEFDPSAQGVFGLLTTLGGGNGAEAAQDRLLTAYFDHLTVMSPTKSRILQIAFSSRDPELAAKAANAIASQYIDFNQQAKRDDARQAAESLKPLVADLQRRATEADAKVSDFRVANGLYDSSENRSLPTQQLGEIATKLADARAAQSDASARARALRDLLSRSRLGDAGEIASNDLVRAIASRRSAVQAELAAQSRTLLPGHPRTKELEAQVSEIERQLRAAVEKAARGLENDARVKEQTVANLTRLLDDQKQTAGVANGEETRLKELQRQAKTLKDQLESESAKYQAALTRENAENTPADARVVSRALAPSVPAFPRKIPVTLFGALAGLFFSSFYVVAREMGGSSPPAPAAIPAGTPAFGRRRREAASLYAPDVGASVAAFGARARDDQGVQPEVRQENHQGENHQGENHQGESCNEVGETRCQAQGETRKKNPGEPLPAVVSASKQKAGGALAEPLNYFGRLKDALAEFGAPAVRLDAPAAPEPAARRELSDIWVRDPFACEGRGDEPVSLAEPEPPALAKNFGEGSIGPGGRSASEAPQPSRDLIARIAAAGEGNGVTALLADASTSSPPCALVVARALSREGRAILIETGPDPRLHAALAGAGDNDRPGLAQLLAGEASYAEAITRDARSRLHLLASGGPLDAEGEDLMAEDLGLVIEVLRATYDFVLLAVRADALGLGLARDADAVVVLGPDSVRRDHLHDDFAGAGARELILASPDESGGLSAGAA